MQRAVLRNYPVAKDRPDDLDTSCSQPDPNQLGLIQSGLRSATGEPGAEPPGDLQPPNSKAMLAAAATSWSCRLVGPTVRA